MYFNIGDPLAFASMIQNAAVPDGSTDGAFDVLRKFRLEHEAEVAAREAKKKAAAERRARRGCGEEGSGGGGGQMTECAVDEGRVKDDDFWMGLALEEAAKAAGFLRPILRSAPSS